MQHLRPSTWTRLLIVTDFPELEYLELDHTLNADECVPCPYKCCISIVMHLLFSHKTFTSVCYVENLQQFSRRLRPGHCVQRAISFFELLDGGAL